jgi:hypothetical protein
MWTAPGGRLHHRAQQQQYSNGNNGKMMLGKMMKAAESLQERGEMADLRQVSLRIKCLRHFLGKAEQ